jgi:hypothetical protein
MTDRASSVSAKERAWLRPSLRWYVNQSLCVHSLTYNPSWRNQTCTRHLSWTGNLYIHHCMVLPSFGFFGTEGILFSEFCVSVAGYLPSGPIRTPLFTPSYFTPTLHVLGRTDVVVVEERSKQLLEVSAVKRVEYHPGGTFAFVCARSETLTEGRMRVGHFVPASKPWREFFSAWMDDPTAKIPSPTPSW